MKPILERQAKRISKEAKKAGLNVNVREVEGNSDMILAANPDVKKVVLIVIDQLSTDKKQIRAFTINLKKWDWAEAEGFTEKDLLGRLSDQVFKEVTLKQIIEKLC